MDKRALDESAAIINAACRDWYVPVGGGSMALASEVKVAAYTWGDGKTRYGMRARAVSAWYWLTDGQVAGMVARARSLVAV